MIEISIGRMKKYKRKISFIIDNLNDLPPLDQEDSPYYGYFLDSLYYKFQTSIDATMDIIAMLCRDHGKVVSDDYNNIDCLKAINLLTNQQIKNLKSINGLRNVIVHRYNHIEGDIIIESKDFVLKELLDFINIVRETIQDV